MCRPSERPAADTTVYQPVQEGVIKATARLPVQPEVKETTARLPVQPEVKETTARLPVQPEVKEKTASIPVQPEEATCVVRMRQHIRLLNNRVSQLEAENEYLSYAGPDLSCCDNADCSRDVSLREFSDDSGVVT